MLYPVGRVLNSRPVSAPLCDPVSNTTGGWQVSNGAYLPCKPDRHPESIPGTHVNGGRREN